MYQIWYKTKQQARPIQNAMYHQRLGEQSLLGFGGGLNRNIIQMPDADCIVGSGSSNVGKRKEEKKKKLRQLLAPGVDLPEYSECSV